MGKIDPNEHFSAPRTCTENEKEGNTKSGSAPEDNPFGSYGSDRGF